jgi:cytochrome c oxidase subunit IV
MAYDATAQLMQPDDHGHEHPSNRKYVEIALILTAITLVEVAIYYVQWMHDSGALVPTLVVLSLVKFFTVIAFYMHLKFDDPLFRRIFLAGLFLSVAVITVVITVLVTHRIEIAQNIIN